MDIVKVLCELGWFDQTDLADNRAGRLSRLQRVRLIGAVVLRSVFMLSVGAASLYLAQRGHALPAGLVLLAGVMATGWRLLLEIPDLLVRSPAIVDGVARICYVPVNALQVNAWLWVGRRPFKLGQTGIPPIAGCQARAYYLPASGYLLSVELLDGDAA